MDCYYYDSLGEVGEVEGVGDFGEGACGERPGRSGPRKVQILPLVHLQVSCRMEKRVVGGYWGRVGRVGEGWGVSSIEDPSPLVWS